MEVSDLKRRVSRHFFDLVDEDANPLVVALALQDNSSVGLQHYADEFRSLHEELRQALRTRVEASYQGFNESVGVYRQVLGSLKSSHECIQGSKSELETLYDQFGKHKPMLKSLHESSVRYKRKLELLADLEMLQQLPATYEANVAAKRFADARQQLGQALEVINSRNLLGQKAVKPFLAYVQTQRSELVAKLVDEIQATVYLESPYSQKRLEPGNQDFREFIAALPALPIPVSAASKSILASGATSCTTVTTTTTSASGTDSGSPEANSFAYLALLIQTLADLQSLTPALEGLLFRVPQELQRMALGTSLEIVKDLQITAESLKKASEGQTMLEQFRHIDQGALDTLARTLYAKLARFLEAQRAIAELAPRFGANYDLDGVCRAVVNAVKSFLLSYIGGDSVGGRRIAATVVGGGAGGRKRSGTVGSAASANTNGNGNGGGFRGPVFEFGAGDEDSRGLRDFEELRKSLEDSVPGLLADDPQQLFAETRQQERLEVVAPAHILNIRPLLEPSAEFFAVAAGTVVSDTAKHAFDAFLDTFVRESFVPRLQEAFNEAIDDIAGDESAQDELRNWRALAQLPLTNGSVQFAETVALLAQLLDTGASYRESYAAMLVGLVARISHYLGAQLETMFKLPSLDQQQQPQKQQQQRRAFKIWDFVVSNPRLLNAMTANYKSELDRLSTNNKVNTNTKQNGRDVEFDVYFSKRKTPQLERPVIGVADLLDIRCFRRTALMITSIRWFVLQLRRMRVEATSADTAGAAGGSNGESVSLRVRRRWSLLDAGVATNGGTATTTAAVTTTEKYPASLHIPPLPLPAGATTTVSASAASLMKATAMLAGRTLSEYDSVINYLEDIAFKALCALRADTFLRVVYHFDQMISRRDFQSSNRGEERDPVVDRLQQELSLVSQVFESHLRRADSAFVFAGIPRFMNELFILEGENISDMNEAGQNQMLTNIFALQQMLTSIVEDPRDVDFSRATGFYTLFRLNPTLIIEKAREGDTDLGSSDLKLLLQIRHRNAAAGGSSSHAFGTLTTHLTQVDHIFSGAKAAEAATPNVAQPAAPAKSAVEPLKPKSSAPSKAAVPPQSPPRVRTSVPALKSPSQPKDKHSTAQNQSQPSETQQRQHQQSSMAPKQASTAQKQPQQQHAQPYKSPAKLAAEEAAQKLREERALLKQQKLAEQKQAEVEAAGEKLRREREQLKSASAAASTNWNHPVTAVHPAPSAAKSPLFNSSSRFESNHHQSKGNGSTSSQPQSSVPAPPPHQRDPSTVRKQRSLPKVDTSLSSRRGSDTSPQTPDQPTSAGQPRTPSERALDAAQRVRVRQLPPTARRG